MMEQDAAFLATMLLFERFLVGIRAVFPESTHQMVGKDTGETSHVERWNTTLRQRLGRFVRKTLSCSKKRRSPPSSSTSI